MAKLNKGQAMNAMISRIILDADVKNTDPRDLRLMDYTQMQESAYRLVNTNHGALLGQTFDRYRGDVASAGTQQVMSIWREAVREFEDSDPTIQAERSVRSYVYTIEHMITEADETLAKFTARLAENPFYALENSTSAMQAAANKDMALRAKNMLETHSVEEVKAAMLDSLRFADGVRLSGSTCPTTNLMARAKMVATMQLAGLRY